MAARQKDGAAAVEINALLGRGTRFEGKLSFDGRVRLDGLFVGEIFSDDVLILGEDAEVRGDIEVGTLIVRGGKLHGNVRAHALVELHAPGEVHGDIHAPRLFVDKGAVFDGRCTMDGASARDLAEAPAPGAAFEPEGSSASPAGAAPLAGDEVVSAGPGDGARGDDAAAGPGDAGPGDAGPGEGAAREP